MRLTVVIFLLIIISGTFLVSAKSTTGRFVITGGVIEGNETLADVQENGEGFFSKVKEFFKSIIDFFKSDLELATAFEVSGSFQVTSFCGDNNVDYGEECDLSNLANQTCSSLGYAYGILNCTSDCYFNESLCAFSPEQPPSGGGGGGSRFPPRECEDGIDNDEDGLVDFIDDPGCTNLLDDSEFNPCFVKWECSDWTSCKKSTQQRVCNDLNSCEETKVEIRECVEIIPTVEIPFIGLIALDFWFLIYLLIIFLIILILTIIIYRKVKKKQRKTRKKKH
ncbi:MAG: hypothetical protein ABIE22_03570 [archaeon]